MEVQSRAVLAEQNSNVPASPAADSKQQATAVEPAVEEDVTKQADVVETPMQNQEQEQQQQPQQPERASPAESMEQEADAVGIVAVEQNVEEEQQPAMDQGEEAAEDEEGQMEDEEEEEQQQSVEQEQQQISTPEGFVAAMQAKTFHFVEVQELVDLDNNMVQELTRVREHFLKLKGQYLELETKQTLLEHLVQDDVLENLSEADIANLDMSVTEGKNSIYEVREEIRAVKAELKASIVALVDKWQGFEAKRRVFEHSFDEEGSKAFREKVDKAREANKEGMRYGKSDDDAMSLDTKAKCEAVLANQTQMLQNLDGEIDALTAQLQGLEAQLDPVKASVETLRVQVRALQQEDKVQVQGHEETSRQAAWYAASAGVLSELNGVQVSKESRPRETALLLKAGTPTQYTLRLSFSDDACEKLSSAQLAPPDVGISDIVSWAVESQNPSFLVREVQARLFRLKQRKEQVDAATRDLGFVATQRGGETVLSTELEDGVTCKLVLDADFPAAHSRVRVEDLRAMVGWEPEQLQAIMDKLNTAEPCSLGDLVTKLKEAVRQ